MVLKPGLSAQIVWPVTPERSAARMNNGSVKVFATPSVIAVKTPGKVRIP